MISAERSETQGESSGQTGEQEETSLHRIPAREAAILMTLAVAVGLGGGVCAVALSSAVHWATRAMSSYHGTWFTLFLPGIGAALSAAFLRYLLKDHAGHGVPQLIHSASLQGGELPPSMIYSRLISSFLTVGSGGSAGLEGPIATCGGAIGSTAGKQLDSNERRRTLLLGYGVAGAVAGIFNAPLTGTVFALEVILGEWSALTILPSFIAAVSATQFSRLVLGNNTVFVHLPAFYNTVDLFSCALLGVGMGLFAVGFQRCLRWTEKHFSDAAFFQRPGGAWMCAGCGGLAVGALGVFVPEVLHDGYEMISAFLSGGESLSLFAVGLFLVLKLIASCLTLGSGGSGGVFAPSLVLGSAAGFGYGLTLQRLFPFVGFSNPSVYSLVGMAGMVAGLMHAPLTGMFLVLEITAGYELILPLMIVSALAMLISYYFVSGSVYTEEFHRKGDLGRRGSDYHLLQTMNPRELLDQDVQVIEEGMLLEDFVELFKRSRRNLFPVVEHGTQRCLGVVFLDDIRSYLFERALYPLVTMGSLMHRDILTISTEESALSAIRKFERSGAWSLPVVDQERFVGMISKSTLFDRYRRELIVHTAA